MTNMVKGADFGGGEICRRGTKWEEKQGVLLLLFMYDALVSNFEKKFS